MPRSSTDWIGSEALWITVKGWAKAAHQAFGNSWIVTSDAIFRFHEDLSLPAERKEVHAVRNAWVRFLPQVTKSFLKDISLWRWKKHAFDGITASMWEECEIKFVWQQHDLFGGPGKRLASDLDAPLILYVHAAQVWEARKWGVERPVWGTFLERKVELADLVEADLIACVSEQVAAKLCQMGVPQCRQIISPMCIDPDILNGGHSEQISKLQSERRITIGWIGSFRKFHGLENLLRAFAELLEEFDQIELVLIGDGVERERMKELSKELGIGSRVRFIGKLPHESIQHSLRSFHIGIVSAKSSHDFHYSPLKLREYLGAGLATVAPAAGEIPNSFINGSEVLLYSPEKENSLKNRIRELIINRDLRHMLGMNGRRKVLSEYTWAVQLERMLQKLGEVKSKNKSIADHPTVPTPRS